VLVEECSLSNNQGSVGGAVIADGIADVTLRRTTVTGNRGSLGGALSVREGARVVIDDCTISGNEAADAGGAAIYLRGTTTDQPQLSITGSTIEGGDPSIVDADGQAKVTIQP
jgi:hypothetical protein